MKNAKLKIERPTTSHQHREPAGKTACRGLNSRQTAAAVTARLLTWPAKVFIKKGVWLIDNHMLVRWRPAPTGKGIKMVGTWEDSQGKVIGYTLADCMIVAKNRRLAAEERGFPNPQQVYQNQVANARIIAAGWKTRAPINSSR